MENEKNNQPENNQPENNTPENNTPEKDKFNNLLKALNEIENIPNMGDNILWRARFETVIKLQRIFEREIIKYLNNKK